MQYNNKMRKQIIVGLFVLSIFISASASASVDMSCFDKAANDSGVSKDILVAIAKVESGFDGNAIHRNRDGSFDIGVMQINSIHFPLLAEAGISKKDLFIPCVNIHVGARIFKKCMERYGNTWRAVAAYNPGDQTYPHKVFRALSSINKRGVRGDSPVKLAIKG